MFVNATFEKHSYRFLDIKCNRVTSTTFIKDITQPIALDVKQFRG